MTTEYSTVMTTTSSEIEAKKIAEALLNKKLAACVQIIKIKSYFTWKDTINEENEFLLFIKSRKRHYKKIEEVVKSNHSYEIPEIIHLPVIDGFKGYLKWIDEVTTE